MNVIEIIPIARGTHVETLSYFTSENPPLGAIVDVPLRSKTIHGIVSSVHPAAEMKGDLKTADFSLKKIEKVKARDFLSVALVNAARTEADYVGATLGATLKAMVHDSIFAEAGKLTIALTSPEKAAAMKGTTNSAANGHVSALQGDDEDRYGAYRSLIRQEFARKKSILFLAPTVEESGNLKKVLEKGIEKYIFILHSGMTPKKIREEWNKAAEEKHPIVMIATGSFMVFQRSDQETIVIERESMRGWKSQRRPYLDLRHAIETYAKASGLRLYISDLALRIETSRRQSQGDIETGSLYKARSVSSAHDSVIDMKQYKGGASFRIFSDAAEALLQRTHDESAHMVVIAARKGLAPSTVCADCHTIVVC
ncbi:MAG: hypothetical protein P4L61_02140, partial [Candidatus Pacebacteria bacterium]|nr:hypothetical protein [Candidatus Paceibacterota bacterium]